MKGGRNSRVSMTSPRILRSESCLGKDPLEGSPQRGASETTHLSQVPGEGRGAEGSRTHRLRSSGAQTPAAWPWRRFALTSEPEDQSASAPRRLARNRLASEWRGGPQKLEEQVTMDAVALSNHGSGKPCLTLEGLRQVTQAPSGRARTKTQICPIQGSLPGRSQKEG